MMLQMLGVFAEFEHATIVDRVTAGLERRVREGRWVSGRAPYGYPRANGLLVPDPVKAPIARRIYQLYAEGKLGTTAIARQFEAEGAPAPRKQGWSPNALQLILANPAYLGLIRWKESLFEGLHEPLVDEELFEKAQQILRRRGEDASLRRGNPSEFLLSGLVRCDHCGRAYVGTSAHGRRSRYTYYACSTRYKYGSAKCCGERLSKDRLEAAVLSQLAELYRDGRLIEQALAPAATHTAEERPRVEERIEATRIDIARVERKLQRYFEAFETGDLSARSAKNASVATVSASRPPRAGSRPRPNARDTGAHAAGRGRPRWPCRPTRRDPCQREPRASEGAPPPAHQRDPRAQPPPNRPTYRVPAAVRAIPSKVELAGLEPATSWVRSRIGGFQLGP
jgi:Recombinase/Recombinase zinc beta ribbon domain